MGSDMMPFAIWLKGTQLSWFITHFRWIWASCEVLHFVGMCWLFGCIAVLDLRIIGIWKTPAVAAVSQLIPWGIGGFVINVVTGTLFFIGEPLQYVGNPAFWLKMLLIFLAAWNVVIFYLSGIAGRIEALGAEDDAPIAAKIIAGSSLVLWVGVMFFGRMLPYLGASF
jgi:hypothetical protein